MTEQANPEVTATIIAHVLLANELTFEHETNSNLGKQIENAIFADWLKEGNEEYKAGDKKVTVDLSKTSDLTQETAKVFVDLLANFPDEVNKVFASYKEFKAFEADAEKQGLKLPSQVKIAVQRKFPILILIDVGGSILYRSGDKLALERRGRDTFCQIRQHYHYYRPQFQHFLASLVSHPRVKLAFNTSITRKNVMPLLFQMFDLKELNPYRAMIFAVFDQTYQVPDQGPKGYETKRSLERIFDYQECKNLGFGLSNTLMIDSEAKKVRDYKDNSVIIKPYSLDQVLSPSED